MLMAMTDAKKNQQYFLKMAWALLAGVAQLEYELTR